MAGHVAWWICHSLLAVSNLTCLIPYVRQLQFHALLYTDLQRGKVVSFPDCQERSGYETRGLLTSQHMCTHLYPKKVLTKHASYFSCPGSLYEVFSTHTNHACPGEPPLFCTHTNDACPGKSPLFSTHTNHACPGEPPLFSTHTNNACPGEPLL